MELMALVLLDHQDLMVVVLKVAMQVLELNAKDLLKKIGKVLLKWVIKISIEEIL